MLSPDELITFCPELEGVFIEADKAAKIPYHERWHEYERLKKMLPSGFYDAAHRILRECMKL